MQNFECDNSTKPTSSRISTKSCLIVAVALFCVMVAVSALPGTANALSSVFYSKLLHFTAFALISTLVYSGMRGAPAARALRTLAFIVVLGSIDELIRLVLPYRNPSWLDWKFDMLAALTCVGMLMLLHPVLVARRAASFAQINNRSVRRL